MIKREFKRRMNVGAGVFSQKERFLKETWYIRLYYCSMNSFKEMFWNLLTPVVDPKGWYPFAMTYSCPSTSLKIQWLNLICQFRLFDDELY